MATAANQSSGILECIRTLGSCKTCIYQCQCRFIRDSTDRKQTGVVIIREYYTIKFNWLIPFIDKLYAAGIEIHVCADIVSQLHRLMIIKHICVGIDYYPVCDFLTWIPIRIKYQFTTCRMIGRIYLLKIFISSNCNFC